MLKIVFIAILSLIPAVTPAQSTQPLGPGMIGRVAVNRGQIVFHYAGDLWAVGRAGGEARRLTTHPGDENFPARITCDAVGGERQAISAAVRDFQ